MKLVSLLLLPAGWFIVLAAVVLLHPGASRGAFVLAGIGVQALGLVFLVRSHLTAKDEDE